MRVYHFINRKYGLQALRRKRLKVSLIDQLNDPFELVGIASDDPDERQAFAEVKAGLAKYTGMLCFSGKWSNPVQWSHYADRHRGLSRITLIDAVAVTFFDGLPGSASRAL